MERKVGLRSGQRPVGYHASKEGLDELRHAQNDASRARRSSKTSFKNRLNALHDDESPPDEESASDELDREDGERVRFHPNGPTSRSLKPGERWRLKG